MQWVFASFAGCISSSAAKMQISNILVQWLVDDGCMICFIILSYIFFILFLLCSIQSVQEEGRIESSYLHKFQMPNQ